MPRKKAAETRAGRIIRWIHRYLRVPEGKDVGKPIRLRKWQQDDLRKIYDNKHGTRRAILSFARKNAKSTEAAMLALVHLCGPEARRNSELYSSAQSRDQAAVVFKLAAKMVRMSAELSAYVVIRDTVKELFCPELGSTYKALSAEVATKFGLSPVLVIHDELGQVRGPKSQLYEALETATAAQESPLSVVISTQAPTDADLLSVLIDDALAGHDPRVVISLYTADPDLDPFSEEAIRQANPAYGDFQNAAEVRAMAEDARRMPSREPEYRNLVLNQRVEASAPFIVRSVWEKCGAPARESFKGLPVYGGLDLSATTDLTAKLWTAETDSVWHVKPTFWLPEEGLRERARLDRVPYDLWADQGFLETAPGPSIDYEWVALDLRKDFDELDVKAMAFDRWNFRHLRPWLVKAGFTEAELALFVEFGQGFQSMSPALRTLETLVMNARIAHGNHPVLTMCAANAVVQTDPAGNRKLTKARSRGRIDGLVALTMAIAVATTEEAPREREYQMIIV